MERGQCLAHSSQGLHRDRHYRHGCVFWMHPCSRAGLDYHTTSTLSLLGGVGGTWARPLLLPSVSLSAPRVRVPCNRLAGTEDQVGLASTRRILRGCLRSTTVGSLLLELGPHARGRRLRGLPGTRGGQGWEAEAGARDTARTRGHHSPARGCRVARSVGDTGTPPRGYRVETRGPLAGSARPRPPSGTSRGSPAPASRVGKQKPDVVIATWPESQATDGQALKAVQPAPAPPATHDTGHGAVPAQNGAS